MPDILIGTEDMPLILPDDYAEELVLTPDSKAKACKDQRDALDIVYGPNPTYLVGIATSKEIARNVIHKIPCKKCIPIGGYVYDATIDAYTISCSDYVVLGYIPVCMYLKISPYYAQRIPMCDAVVKRFLNQTQKKDLKSFRAVYKPEDYNLHFVQMIDCNG